MRAHRYWICSYVDNETSHIRLVPVAKCSICEICKFSRGVAFYRPNVPTQTLNTNEIVSCELSYYGRKWKQKCHWNGEHGLPSEKCLLDGNAAGGCYQYIAIAKWRQP